MCSLEIPPGLSSAKRAIGFLALRCPHFANRAIKPQIDEQVCLDLFRVGIESSSEPSAALFDSHNTLIATNR